MKVELVELVSNDRSRPTIVLDKLPAQIGRAATADVQVCDPCISRHHCELDQTAEALLVVRDLGSKNGTFVNDARVSEAHLLPGDEFRLGQTRLAVRYATKGDVEA
jgi:pSer/pThr/pTyr-binding forkhead associated (FHA) protein